MLLNQKRAGSLIQGVRQFNQMWNCCRFMEHTNTGQLYTEDLQKFFRKAYQANVNTWNRKYKEDDQMLDILPATGEPMNKYQVLKTLQCLHYNIEAEYVPESKELISQLQTMINEIMYNIVTESEDYQEASWG